MIKIESSFIKFKRPKIRVSIGQIWDNNFRETICQNLFFIQTLKIWVFEY